MRDVINHRNNIQFITHICTSLATTQHGADMPRILPWLTKDDLRASRDRSAPTATPNAQVSLRRRLRTPSPGASSHGSGDRTKKRVVAKDDTPSKGIDFMRSCQYFPSRSIPVLLIMLTVSSTESAHVADCISTHRRVRNLPDITTILLATNLSGRYIIPGFEHDDMYIMVEDEFYAIAQQFTRHLHHAEYIRRKKQAKKMNASVLRDMERPTDSTTRMSGETLKRKQSERLHERQRKGLEPVVRRPENSDDSDDSHKEEDVIEDEDEEREDDPWYGTSLHAFMASPRKNRSLVGLEKIRSNTRAAAGFGSEIAVTTRPGSSSLRADGREADDGLATSSGEDDDLEIVETRSLPQSEVRVRTSTVKRESPEVDARPVTQEHTAKRREVAFNDRHTTVSSGRQQQPATKHGNGGFVGNPLFETIKGYSTTATKPSTSNMSRKRPDPGPRKEAPITASKTSTSFQARKRIFLDELDDVTSNFEEDGTSRKGNIIQDQPRKELSTSSTAKESRPTYRTTSEQKQQEDKMAKKSRVADIPTFLV